MEFNEYTVAHQPEKPFVLIAHTKGGMSRVTWHDSMEDLQDEYSSPWRKDYTEFEALEICTCKEIDLSAV